MEQHEKDCLKQYRIMADTVKNWNGGKDWNIVVIAVLIPVMMGQIAVLSLCGMTGELYLLLLFYLIGLGALFVWSHCEKYVKVEGKNGKPGQYIYEFCYGTPFSLVLYYKEIGRRLRKKYIVLVILILVAFLLANSFRLRKNFWLVSGICLEGILIMLGTSELGFSLHRYVAVRRYQAILKGKKKNFHIMKSKLK